MRAYNGSGFVHQLVIDPYFSRHDQSLGAGCQAFFNNRQVQAFFCRLHRGDVALQFLGFNCLGRVKGF